MAAAATATLRTAGTSARSGPVNEFSAFDKRCSSNGFQTGTGVIVRQDRNRN